jgi:hypothetical protein
MRVLVACEFSGRVRDAFRARGHNAWSCDLPGIRPQGVHTKYHYRVDALDAIEMREWDLLIAHPPCTYLANSGVRWLKRDRSRFAAMLIAVQFFKQLWRAPVPHVCIENPIMHSHAAKRIGVNWSQKIQPFEYGDPETKATCLWLRGLPLLEPTKIMERREPRVWMMSGKDKAKRRSITPQGIARAMADQWSVL